jgi:shikimate kinase
MKLVGMMGSGKTTVGREAAIRVGVALYDTDRMVEEMARTTIDAIWEDVGENGYRELERRVIATIPVSDFVAAAGGGAVLSLENREHISRGEPIVWRRASPGQLAKRLETDGSRPLLAHDPAPEARLAALHAERSSLYSGVATDLVDTDDRDVEDVIRDVVELWRR